MTGKMFEFIDETWNPVAMRCPHRCRYCWSEELKDGKLRGSPRYRNLRNLKDAPVLIEKELDRKFKSGTRVFVEDMGDLFADSIPVEWISKIIKIIRNFPQASFLFMTKNPRRYLSIEEHLPFSVLLGVTIETDRDTSKFSHAPSPRQRFDAMAALRWRMKFVSIEPICDFDLDELAAWIYTINPQMVAVGYDNYNNFLPEPPLDKTMSLITRLEKFTRVYRKTIREGRGIDGTPLSE
jgi:protein gp37